MAVLAGHAPAARSARAARLARVAVRRAQPRAAGEDATASGEREGGLRVVVAGGGPAGLLVAHDILARDPTARVSVFERRPDWSADASAASGRQYSIGLGARGRDALTSAGLWDAVYSEGVASDRFFIHATDTRRFNIRQKAADGVPPSLLINRGVLCGVLARELRERFGGDGGRVSLEFESQIASVDLESSNVEVAHANGSTQEHAYDLLVGADGVRSRVRQAMQDAGACEAATRELKGGLKVIHGPMPSGLEPDAVHAFGGRYAKDDKDKARGKFGLFSIPAPGGNTCTLVSWEDESAPSDLLACEDGRELSELIAERFPSYGAVSLESANSVVAQKPTRSAIVSCDSYAYTNERAGSAAVLLGDAAHSTGGTLGQGANSALQDAKALSEALCRLGESGGDVCSAAREYSAAQAPQGARAPRWRVATASPCACASPRRRPIECSPTADRCALS